MVTMVVSDRKKKRDRKEKYILTTPLTPVSSSTTISLHIALLPCCQGLFGHTGLCRVWCLATCAPRGKAPNISHNFLVFSVIMQRLIPLPY